MDFFLKKGSEHAEGILSIGLLNLFPYNYSKPYQEFLITMYFTVTNSDLSWDTSKHDTMNHKVVF